MTSEKLSLSFARIVNDLKTKIKTLNDTRSDQQEIALLERLLDDLKNFESVQKNWLTKSGLIAKYHQQSSQIQLSQDALNREAAQTIRDSAQLTIHMAEFIIAHIDPNDSDAIKFGHDLIEDEMNYELLKNNHKELLDDVVNCAKQMKQHANSLTTRLFKFQTKSVYKIAQQLNAVYIPFSQVLDPIHGGLIDLNTKALVKWEGVCFGHVKTYGKTISESGNYLTLPRMDAKTLKMQEKEGHLYAGSFCDNTSFVTIYTQLEKLLSLTNDQDICVLSYEVVDAYGHAMGYRKFSSGGIEFFDPNYGLFVFKDEKSFLTWATFLIQDYLRHQHKNQCELAIDNIGTQPANAQPTIPIEINNEFRNSKKTDELYNWITEVLKDTSWNKRDENWFSYKTPDGIDECRNILKNPNIPKEGKLAAIGYICEKNFAEKPQIYGGLFEKEHNLYVKMFYKISARICKNWAEGKELTYKPNGVGGSLDYYKDKFNLSTHFRNLGSGLTC